MCTWALPLHERVRGNAVEDLGMPYVGGDHDAVTFTIENLVAPKRYMHNGSHCKRNADLQTKIKPGTAAHGDQCPGALHHDSYTVTRRHTLKAAHHPGQWLAVCAQHVCMSDGGSKVLAHVCSCYRRQSGISLPVISMEVLNV